MTRLIAPYGGRLVDLRVPEGERGDLAAHAGRLPSVQLASWAVQDLEMLATGAFSPLTGFLGADDCARVLSEMRLADGTLWPIPVTLPLVPGTHLVPGRDIALRDEGNDILAVLTISEVYPHDPGAEARALCGKEDPRHPLVARMAAPGSVCVAGRLRVLTIPRHADFPDLRLTPAQTRARLEALGNDDVVAFQTRNPMHRTHEEICRRAQALCGGSLLVHPVAGLAKPGDVGAHERIRCCRVTVERHFDPARTLLAVVPMSMRFAGPREAVWHAIVRRNYGANRLLVGRDHAAPGPDSAGRPFYPPYAAQDLVARTARETGVEPVPFREMVYLPDEDRYEEADAVRPGTRTVSLSGTAVRERLDRGDPLPPWMTRPEVAAILEAACPPRRRQGFCVWFTGLSGAGKSTVAEMLASLLQERGRRVTLLDGDVVRTHLSKGLGFSREDRDANVLRIAFVASEIVRHGGAALCAAVSPYRAAREACRDLVGPERFVEVFVDAPLSVCESRDTKGLYARARRGEARGVTGIDDPYEPPGAPEVHLETSRLTPGQGVAAVSSFLERAGFISPSA